MFVTLLSTNGPWLDAEISTDDGVLTVMDEFSIDASKSPNVGESFEVELSALLDHSDSWEAMFTGNTDRRKGLNQVKGWRYRAFGEVTSIDPVVVDCGILQVPDVFHTHDARVIGEYVAFGIERLDATMFS